MKNANGPDCAFEVLRPYRYDWEQRQANVDQGEADLVASFKRAGKDASEYTESVGKGKQYDDTHAPPEKADPVPGTEPVSGLSDTWQDPLSRKLPRTILMPVPYTAVGMVAVPRRPYNQNATFVGAGNVAFDLAYDASFQAASIVTLPGDRNYCFMVPAGTEVWMRSTVVVGTLSVIIEPLIEC